MTVSVDTTSASLSWEDASNSDWNSLQAYDWTEVLQFTYVASIAETLSIVEAKGMDTALSFVSNLSMSDSYIDIQDFIIKIVETFGVTDKVVKVLPTISIEEFTYFQDSIRKVLPNKDLSEIVQFSEGYNTVGNFIRLFSDNITTTETFRKFITLNRAEQLVFLDDFSKGFEGVISDLTILDVPMNSIADFEDALYGGKIPGFNEFKSFIQGDYTYKDAIVKALLEPSESDSRVEMHDLKVTIDLPDIIYRGEHFYDHTLGTSTDTITFPKPFSTVNGVPVIPEVTFVVKGGIGSGTPVIDVIEVTNSYIKLVIKDASSGSTQSGTISWTAHGY